MVVEIKIRSTHKEQKEKKLCPTTMSFPNIDRPMFLYTLNFNDLIW